MPSYRVSFQPAGVTIDVAEEETRLDAALRAGLPVPHECRAGRCASCKSVLSGGEVLHGKCSLFALEEAEISKGYILLCRTYPRSDLLVRPPDQQGDGAPAYCYPVRAVQTTVVQVVPLT